MNPFENIEPVKPAEEVVEVKAEVDTDLEAIVRKFSEIGFDGDFANKDWHSYAERNYKKLIAHLLFRFTRSI